MPTATAWSISVLGAERQRQHPAQEHLGFSVRKNLPLDYRSNKQTSEATRMLNVPFPIIRLGEVYLNYAEALNEYYGTSRQDEALYYLNEIRTRAGIPAYEAPIRRTRCAG